MNTTEKFTEKSENYQKARPHYAKAFLRDLQTSVGMNAHSVVADIGSGTGILTADLLPIVSRVYGVEPNFDMRHVAEENLGENEKFVSVNATAETTTLKDHSVNFVVAAQAFHWFDTLFFQKE